MGGRLLIKHLRKILALCIICLLLVVSSWANWQSGAAPNNNLEIRISATRVFTTYSVDSENDELSLSGESSFPLSNSLCSLYYINTTPFLSSNAEQVALMTSWTIAYSLQASIGFAYISTYHVLFDAEFDELDAVQVLGVSVALASQSNSSDEQQLGDFTYTCQEGTTYYFGIILRAQLCSISSISG